MEAPLSPWSSRPGFPATRHRTRHLVSGDPGQPEEAAKLTTELELQATGSAIYDWSTTEELGILITPSPAINDAFQVVPPTGLSLTSGAGIAYVNEVGVTTGRIVAAWTAPADTFILNSGSVEVQWQTVGATIGMTPATCKVRPNPLCADPASAEPSTSSRCEAFARVG